jgi:ribulose-5-phosphate 4-epimerase/fuculose-1-phosphate aldolase
MDRDGRQLEGKWTITPAIRLHVELHRARDNVVVAIHNHPRWATVWAAAGRVPAVYEQTGALYNGEVAIHRDYLGTVDDADNARAVVEAMGDADVCLLANHGVLVLADGVRQAFLRAMSFEWRCREAWHVEALGGGVPMDPGVARRYGEIFNRYDFTGLFEAMARRELRRDPTVLD